MDSNQKTFGVNPMRSHLIYNVTKFQKDEIIFVASSSETLSHLGLFFGILALYHIILT